MKHSKGDLLVVGLMIVSMLFGSVPYAGAQTTTDLQAQISNLLSIISGLQAQLSALQGQQVRGQIVPQGFLFSRTLRLGSRGEDVRILQRILNTDPRTRVAVVGAGSLGLETAYFGRLTVAAVVKFQNLNAAQILEPVGLRRGTGIVGPSTRAFLNARILAGVYGGVPQPPPPPPQTGTTTPPGTGIPTLSVMAGTQPAPTLVPENAARVPFTRFTVTAGTNASVTMTGVTIERTGLGQNAVFDGVVLLDESGNQIGIARTLNTNNQTTIGENIIISAGQSRTFTVAGNMAANLDAYQGQVISLAVRGVNVSGGGVVTGTLPITGASHTINSTLTIGSVSMLRGGTDPGVNQTKEVGTTGYTFSGVRVTAGSQERVWLKSIRWNQTGSAASGDIANLKTVVDGVSYDTIVSSDGKYFTANFGAGILIDKGMSKDISLRGDVVGGSGRTIAFDIAKRTDIHLVGDTFGFGIVPPQTNTCGGSSGTACFTSGEDPWYDAATVTVSAGTIMVSANPQVSAQNIAVNASNQVLGGFTVDVRGEPISVSQMAFNITAAGDEAENITNISLVGPNGAVLAGPVDAVSSSANSAHGTVTFSSAVTFPTGQTKIELRGRLGSTFTTNDTVQASTTPSSQWTNVRGQVTGNTITPTPSSAITSSQMTVRAGALSISVSSQPTARNVIAGARQFEFARYVLDASQAGEDIRLTSLPVRVAFTGANVPNYLTNCQLYDGDVSVTTGSNVVNPASSLATGSDVTFTFDGGGIIIPKGTSKTLSMRCDVSTSATSGTFAIGLNDTSSTFSGALGVTSGQTITEVMVSSSGQTMTSATGGNFSVSEDTSLTYKMAQAGSTNVVIGRFRFQGGTSEDITLRQIALQLTNTASNSPADLVNQRMTIWNGNTQVGVAQFGGANPDHATSTLTTHVTIPRGEAVTLTVRGDLSPQNATEGTPGAFLAVAVDGNNLGLSGTYGTGASSGTTLSPDTTTDVESDGLRVFRTVPTVTVTSSGGTLAAGADLYRFTVTNPNNRDLAIAKVTFTVATTGGAVTGFTLYGDGVAANSSGVDSVGGVLEIYFNASASTTQARIVPANSSKTYVLRAATANDTASVSETLNIALAADAGYPSLATLMGTLGEIDAAASNADNFIWSPLSTTTLQANDPALEALRDWTNGYGMPGFPAVGQDFPIQVWTRPN